MTSDPLGDAHLAVEASSISGDAGALYRVVASLLDDGVPFESVLFDLLMPSETRVGRRWQDGDYLIAEEHSATATIETVVSLLAGSLERSDSGDQVVVATVEGDRHSLPVRLVSAHLIWEGFDTIYLGADIDARDLSEYLEYQKPKALVLSCAMTNHLFGARASIMESHAAGIPVVVGGAGFGPSGRWAGAMGADRWVGSPRDVVPTLRDLDPEIAAAESGAVHPSAHLLRLVDQRPSIVGAARSDLWSTRSKEPDRRLGDDLDLLASAVLVSELVGDVECLVEMLIWQTETLASHGYQEMPLMVGAMTRALDSVDSALAGRLAEAWNIAQSMGE